MKDDPLTIDSSVFISSINPTDKFSKASRQFFELVSSKKNEVVVPFLVVLEIDNALQKLGLTKKWGGEILLKDPNVEVIALDKNFFHHYWLEARKFDLKTADNIMAVTAYHRRASLITWDKRLIRATKKLCNSQTPKEFLEN